MTEDTSGPIADIVLRGGHVIDPQSGRSERAEIGIASKTIVAIGDEVRTGPATQVIDVSGYYVVPGIIDMHAHVFNTHRRSELSLDPRVNTFSSGVTTVVDAGTSGWRDFEEFRKVIDIAQPRVLTYVNIVSSGMGGEWEHEASEMSPRMTAAMALEHRDVVVGIKTAHYWANRPFDDQHLPWTAVDRAVEAGEIAGIPVMVDFYPWLPERPYPELILSKLRPGDIHTHVFAQQFPVIDDAGRVYDHLFKARDRGIIFDLGHGAASFWFRNAIPAIEQGFVPDSISTDLHTHNVNGPVTDMQMTMSKLLNMGLTLEDVIARSTVAPAREIGHPELGTLAIGAEADVAVFSVDQGDFRFVDCGKTVLPGTQRLRAVLTMRAGKVVYNPEGMGYPVWNQAS